MPTSSTDALDKPRRGLPAAERRTQILAAALEVFTEYGASGTTAKVIAERAGITEAFLYRRFSSVEEIHRLAVSEPLERMIDRLLADTGEMVARGDVGRVDLLQHVHELFLEWMVELAPLLVAALDSKAGQDLYSNLLLPKLRDSYRTVIGDVSGWPAESYELDLAAHAMVGMHLGIALENFLQRKEIDIPETARQLNLMFASGLPAATKLARSKKKG